MKTARYLVQHQQSSKWKKHVYITSGRKFAGMKGGKEKGGKERGDKGINEALVKQFSTRSCISWQGCKHTLPTHCILEKPYPKSEASIYMAACFSKDYHMCTIFFSEEKHVSALQVTNWGMKVSKEQFSWDHKDKCSKVKNETICTMSTSKCLYTTILQTWDQEHTACTSPLLPPTSPKFWFFPY